MDNTWTFKVNCSGQG